MTKKQQILAEIERMLDDTSMYRNLDQRTGGSVALARLHTFLDTLPDEPVEKTCKTCGFYENNCPFIRDKFIPYPNKVCKDYTFSTLKAEQEPESEDEKIRREADLEKAARHVYESWMGGTMDEVRRDMVELGKVLNARKED